MALIASTTSGIARIEGPHAQILDIEFTDLGAALESGRSIESIAGAPIRSTVSVDVLELCPTIRRPPKIWAVGYAYSDHRAETSYTATTSAPIIFLKAPSSVIGSGSAIELPAAAPSHVDYEGELAVVIGIRAQAISAADAFAHIAGYTIGNDVSARDVQRGTIDGRAADTSTAKSFDTFTPLGPWLATLDEFADPLDLSLRTTVDGEVRQDSRTAMMIHPVPELISYLSHQTTLEPGDVVMTGTPAGVGGPQNKFLRTGNTVRIAIQGIGVLENTVG